MAYQVYIQSAAGGNDMVNNYILVISKISSVCLIVNGKIEQSNYWNFLYLVLSFVPISARG